MNKKSLNDQFIRYAKKSKLFNKKLFKEGHNFEELIAMSITESLKKAKTKQVADLGTFRRREKMIAGRLEKLVDFIANENILKKIIRGFLINSSRPRGLTMKKALLIFIPLILLPILGFTGWRFVVPRASALLERRAGSRGVAEEGPGQARSDKEDAAFASVEESKNEPPANEESESGSSGESETVTFKDRQVKKEKVDFESKEITANRDRSIIIKTQDRNDTDLKEGEHRSSVVQVNGEFYNKNIYIVKDGDTLWDIAAAFLHNPFLWPSIHKDNAYIKNPNLILPGYKLTIYSKYRE